MSVMWYDVVFLYVGLYGVMLKVYVHNYYVYFRNLGDVFDMNIW